MRLSNPDTGNCRVFPRLAKPFLAVVRFGSPHSPYQALLSDRERYRTLPEPRQNFYGEITAMDRAFGRRRRELRELGAHQNTVLWYCSDHGSLPSVGSAGGKHGLKGQIYDACRARNVADERGAQFER